MGTGDTMPTKKDIRRLLKKGLTGKEAARLVIQDSWEIDNGREGFLSDSELRAIIDSLPPSEGAEYNEWINTYRIISFTLKEAQIRQLLLLSGLRRTTEIASSLAIAETIEWSWPTFMTAKQYEELKAAQREYKLAQLVSLYDVVHERAYELASAEPGALEGPAPEDEPLVEGPHGLIPESYILDKWQEACSWQMETFQENELPIIRKEESRVQELLARLRADRSSLSDEEMDELLQSSGVLVSDLYEAGIPEWTRHVDTFAPGYEGDAKLWGSREGIAIVQEPYPYMMDERGYFDTRQLIRDTFEWSMIKEAFSEDDNRQELEEMLKEGVKSFKKQVKAWLAFHEVIGAVSELIGVDMTENLSEWHQELERAVDKYLLYNEPSQWTGEALSGLKLPPIRLASLRPTPSSVQYLRERIAISLGEGWYSGERLGRHIDEAVQAAEFPEDSDEWELEPVVEEASDG